MNQWTQVSAELGVFMPHNTKPRPNDEDGVIDSSGLSEGRTMHGSSLSTSVAIDLDNKRTKRPDSREMGETFQFHREIIVSGDDALSKTIAEELRGAGARIVKINTAADLLGAGVHRARAVVCAGPNDAINLEIALLARQYSPNVRLCARSTPTWHR
jgi:voltage-gated potassium channel Kch